MHYDTRLDKLIPSGSLVYIHTVGRAYDNILIIAGKLQSTCFLEYSIASEREKKNTITTI